MALTVKQCSNSKPGRLSDGRGLYLLTKPMMAVVDGVRVRTERAGARSWVLRVQYDGKRSDYGLGSFTETPVSRDYDLLPLSKRRAITLEEARDKAALGRALGKAGIPPSKHWNAPGPEAVPTFEKAAREYHTQISKGWRNGKHNAQWIATLVEYAFPTLGNVPVNDIDASAMQRVLMPIWLSKGETARRVRQRMAAVLDYAKGKGWRDTEAPVRALSKLMGGIKQPRGGNFAAMPYKDLPAFMTKLREGEFSIGRLALQFLILTAARSGEVRKAKWKEIELEAGEWRVPAAHTKTGRLHIVPLVPAAVDLLGQLRFLFAHKPEEFVFPGLSGIMSDATLAKVLRVNGGAGFTVHGMRSVFRDWAADTGFADAWAEAALAHGNPDKTEAAYKRTTYFEQRRDKLMPAWASFALGDGSNVVSLAERRV